MLSKLFMTLAVLLAMVSLHADEEHLNLKNGLMANGYDVVSYLDAEKAQKGDEAHTTTHQGATYRFSSEANKATFLANPERYVPAYGGWCAYAMASDYKYKINPKTFTIIDDKVYLFYSGFWVDTLKKWNKEGADELKAKADIAWAKFVAEHDKK